MAAHFTPVSLTEMHAFLAPQGFKVVDLPGCDEVVYGKIVGKTSQGYSVCQRVYTGCLKATGQSRGVGKDAIRTCTVVRLPTGEIRGLAKEKRVHRVAGWRTNLAERLTNWQENTPDKVCPKCGKPMALRKSKYGQFLGCTGFPACKEKASVEGPKADLSEVSPEVVEKMRALGWDDARILACVQEEKEIQDMES